MFAALMAAIPPYREDGDDDTIRRIIRRPNNSLDALAAAPKEIGVGVRKAAEGIVLDPVAGWHEYHVAGMVLGLVKATVGVPVRPLIGGLEMTSKIFAALALSSLGRDGIVGKLRRRVRAPGAYAEDATEAAAYTEEGARAFSEARNYARSLQAAWQRVLPEFFPQLREDTVGDVLNTRDTRVVLITDKHIAYLRARHLPEHSVYKAKWLIPIEEVQNIRGDPESRKITIVHIKRYDLKLLGVWPVQKKKSLRCGSRVVYEKTVLRLTKVQQAVQGAGEGAEEREKGEGFVGPELNELTIMSQPYTRGREGGEQSKTPQSNLRHVAFQGPLVDK